MYRFIFTAASLATLALAKTDIAGCTSSDVSSPAGASMIYYVPGTGEICEFLDCGGGRAPPKTTVPGCPQYSGTETYSPSFLPGYGAMETGSSSNAAAESTSTASEAEATTEETGSAYAQTTNVATSSLATDYTAASSSDETTLITSPAAYTSAVVGGGASNGTTTVGGGRNNGTVTSGTPSLPESTGAAMEAAKVWVGGIAMMGLGAVVAAL